MAVGYNPRIVTDGLVLALDAGNTKSYPGSGTTWTDLSGNGNNGTLTNGPTYSSDNGGSLTFDGTNEYIDFGTPSISLQPQSISLCCWYKQNSISTYYGVFGWCFFGTGGGFLLDSSNGGIPTVNVGDGSWASSLSSGISLSTNIGYVVGTYDGSSLKIYVNGLLANSQSVVTTIGYSGKGLALGKYFGSASNSFPGNIFNASMYNRALTAQEIQQNYNALKSRYQ